MADYNIKADITANTKGYEAGIKKAQESTKKFSTSVSKFSAVITISIFVSFHILIIKASRGDAFMIL